ncbi:D-alanyl-D-alanine carboxypeptidase [Candidatus Uhrbacteria bacterium]|nr:MAG: D-alanyl-D-alanine carboxypeptidase [Candidatus Uhrbacteria bacterium]
MDSNALLAILSAFTLKTVQEPTLRAYAWNPLPVSRPAVLNVPVKRKQTSLGIDISAPSAIVMDAETGAVLFEKNADDVRPVASLTKLVAAMTYLDTKPDFAANVEIRPADGPSVGRTILPTNERFTAEDVFEGMLVGSINESAKALARSSLGTEDFVKRMNEKAEEVGMKRATFVDASGEDARNRATARDIALALRAAAAYPEITEAMSRSSVTLSGVKKPYLIKTTNLLLSSELNREPYKIIAAKTGTLPEAGHNYALMTEGKDGQKLLVVLLGGETHYSRFQDVKALTYWAFDAYEWPRATARTAAQ